VSTDDLPHGVLALVHGPVRTLTHVELLLALRACQPEALGIDELAGAASATTLHGARHTLHELVAAELIAEVDADRWRFAPRDASARQAVDELALTYDLRPVSLVRAVYERPTRALQSFADAFRFRRSED
jgi:hypothetical protein